MNGREIIAIIKILQKYDGAYGIAGADHDIIYLDGDPDKMSAEDNKRMEELGCHQANDSWCKFV